MISYNFYAHKKIILLYWSLGITNIKKNYLFLKKIIYIKMSQNKNRFLNDAFFYTLIILFM